VFALSTLLAYEACLASPLPPSAVDASDAGHGICPPNPLCLFEECLFENLPNDMYERWGKWDLPAYSAEVHTIEEVQDVVRFANKHKVALSIKSTGHNYAGSSAMKGTLLLWMRNYKKYGEIGEFTDSCGTQVPATISGGGGQPWGELYKAANDDGRYMVVGGGSANVGCCGGWLMGGGLSAFARSKGMGVDNVLQFELVLASGDVVTADACSNTDLFWALRGGGGGSFGVVTKVIYKLHPVFQTTVASLDTYYPPRGNDEATSLQEFYDEGYLHVLNSWMDLYLEAVPDLDPRWGGHNFDFASPTFLLYFVGSAEEAWLNFLIRVREWIDSLGDLAERYGIYLTVGEGASYSSLRSPAGPEYCETQKPGDYGYTACQRFGEAQDVNYPSWSWTTGTTILVPRRFFQDKEGAKRALQYMVFPLKDGGGSYLLGGVMADVAADATAVNPAYRTAATVIIFGSYPGTEVSKILFPESAPCFNHDSKPSWHGSTPAEWQKVYWGAQLERLNRIKDTYDPARRFNSFQGIGFTSMPDTTGLGAPGCGAFTKVYTEAAVAYAGNDTLVFGACTAGQTCQCEAANGIASRRSLLFAPVLEEGPVGWLEAGCEIYDETRCVPDE